MAYKIQISSLISKPLRRGRDLGSICTSSVLKRSAPFSRSPFGTSISSLVTFVNYFEPLICVYE